MAFLAFSNVLLKVEGGEILNSIMGLGSIVILSLIHISAIEQDESVRFDDVLLTYPISKKQIILTRFCGNLIGILLNMALSFLLMLGYVYGGKTTDIRDGIFIWLAGCRCV